MKTNKIISFILSFAMIFNTIFIVNANSNANLSAKSPKEIYTLWTGGSSTHTGNGSKNSPFNMLEDAIDAANDGDTIIIKSSGSGAFLNVRNNKQDKPFVIDKNITIKSESPNKAETINFRLRGLILNADLTLENVTLSFQQKMYDHIFVNGHTLTLKNVKINDGTREIDIFGGSAYDKNGQLIKGYDSKFNLVASKSGEKSVINIINNNNTNQDYVNYEFGKIFAGSMNGASNIPVTINIEDGESDFQTKGIFASGAEEAFVDLDDFMNLDEADPPQEDPNKFPLNATLELNLNNYFPIKDSKLYFDGNGANKVDLTIETDKNGIFDVVAKNIDSLTVNGKVGFSELAYNNQHTNVKSSLNLSNELSEIDLTKSTNKNITINEFIGGGKLRIAKDSLLTINETATGETKLLVGGFGNKSEYISTPSQTLIKTPAGSSATFTLLTNDSQTDEVDIKKDENNEWKVVSLKEKPGITEYNSITFRQDLSDNEMTFIDNPNSNDFKWYAELIFTVDPKPQDLDEFINLVDLYVNDKKITKTIVKDPHYEEETYIGWNYKAINFVIQETENDNFMLFVFAKTMNEGNDITDTVFDYTYEQNNKIKLELVQDSNTLNFESDLIINDNRTPNSSKVDVTGIAITNGNEISNLDLNNYKTKSIEYTVEPNNATNKGVKFESNNTNVLEVSANGELIPKSEGTATITITSDDTANNVSNNITINVIRTKSVQGVEINNKDDILELDLNGYTTKTIRYGITPNNADNTNVIFKSSDKNVLEVADNGELNPKKVTNRPVNVAIITEDGNFIDTASVSIIDTTSIPDTGVEITNKESILELNLNGYTNIVPTEIKYQIAPSNATDKTVTFTSSDPAYLEITNDGGLIPKKVTPENNPVTVTITTKGNRTDTVDVSVVDKQNVTGVEITNKNLELDLKSNTKTSIQYKVLPEDAVDKSVIFESSNTEYLEVDDKGVLTAKKATPTNSPVTITIKTIDGGYTDTASVKIIDKSSTVGSGGGGASGTTNNTKPETENKENTENKEKPVVEESKPNKISIVLPEPLTNQPELTDIKTHWAKEEIKDLQKYNIITGFSNNEFKPDLSIKRGDLFVIIDRILKLSTTELENSVEEIQFKDLSKDKYYYNSINNLVSKGIISGFSDNTIKAEQEITREELAKIIKNLIVKTDIANTIDKNLE
ncbi:MAG: S-layer homology domain-containing protein, partial [Eubacteriales bacterium]|nr:S-layer homology domain-containing protein [Eubacteriales bacterium]